MIASLVTARSTHDVRKLNHSHLGESNTMAQQPERNFYILGNNISHSLSPTIHNAAFAELGLPYHYRIHQTPQLDATVRRMLHDPRFGGASVTFPHKLSIMPLLDSLSISASTLGAVNTVIVKNTASGQQLIGDNTDWLGILNCIKSHGPRRCETAIVIGAGGAARAAVYALQILGAAHLAIVNRTKSTAQRLAADFPQSHIDVFDSLVRAPAAQIIIGCIPADEVEEDDIPSEMFAEGAGLVIEMAYRPPVTALMHVAARQQGWTVLGGVDVLKEQAYAQFSLWTGRSAPVPAIQEALDRRTRAKAM